MTEANSTVTIEDIRQAQQRIIDHIHRTPVIRSTNLDQLSSSALWFKCENLQKVGAFKARGALNAVLELRDSETGTILARSVDRRAAETIGGSFTRSNSVTNSAEARRLIRFWATRLREGLDGFGQ